MHDHEITASWQTLLSQAIDTAHDYLRGAVAAIDTQFGDGYAQKHPALVGAFLQAAAIDFHAASVAVKLQEVAQALDAAGDVVSTALDQLSDIEALKP